MSVLSFASSSHAETNTNECVADLGGIAVCEQRNFLGLPTNLQACCNGVRELARDRCECNPAVDLVLGEEGQQIYDIEPICRIVQPLKWLFVPLRPLRSCNALNAEHEYGCAPNDMQMDAARLGAILAFQSLFFNASDEEMCFNTPAFEGSLAFSFEPDATVSVPYGIGTYSGYNDVAEYLGMAFAGLNHGFWLYDATIDPTKPARLEVSADGSTWITGSTLQGSFARGALPYTNEYLEQDAVFEGCEVRGQEYNVRPTTGLRNWVETYTQAADLSQRWGVEDICRYHTEYCAPFESTRQYDSEQECIDYISSLPLYSPACGPNRPLAGLSKACKFKHHFMIPTNPGLHCAHIGPAGALDEHDHLKCDDVVECSADEGQASWPPVIEIGANTPANVVNAYNASNVGYEDEPFGCGLPSTGSGHHPPH